MPKRKITLALLLSLTILLVAVVVALAGGPPSAPPGQSGGHAPIYLGKALDPGSGQIVEGYALFHHKEEHGGGGGGRDGDEGPPYELFANGLRWKVTEPYYVDSANSRGLDEPTVVSLVETSLDTWDTEVATDIFGVKIGTAGDVDGADDVAPDDKNEVLSGPIAEPNAIAVTIVWGFFDAPKPFREIVEWDAVYDDEDFDWSTSGEVLKMDFQNIATHEFGHAAGMAHPDDTCTDETMYAFAGEGETNKQDLNAGDIEGINKLY